MRYFRDAALILSIVGGLFATVFCIFAAFALLPWSVFMLLPAATLLAGIIKLFEMAMKPEV